MFKVRAAALSDIGRFRAENQDRCLCDEGRRLFGVADGVSGLPGGAEAAQAAVDAVMAACRRLPPGEAPDLGEIVREANQAVIARGRELGAAYGIGTTLTCGHLRGHRLLIAHAGDSRCYRATATAVTCLTEDHSAANEARRRGTAFPHGLLNPRALVRCLGQPSPLPCDLLDPPVAAGERYLFCTDGITEMVPERQLGKILLSAGEPAAVLRALVDAALRRGGLDNASGVLVFIDQP